jgi:hypothetical protein
MLAKMSSQTTTKKNMLKLKAPTKFLSLKTTAKRVLLKNLNWRLRLSKFRKSRLLRLSLRRNLKANKVRLQSKHQLKLPLEARMKRVLIAVNSTAKGQMMYR